MVSAAMRDEWISTDPAPSCFDHSEDRMDLLLRFIAGEPSDAVREHLMACSRCRYIYAVMAQPSC